MVCCRINSVFLQVFDSINSRLKLFESSLIVAANHRIYPAQIYDYVRWHSHLHVLAADGLFSEHGYFCVMPETSLKQLAELFGAHVLNMLKKEGLIDDALINMLLGWKHTSGFSGAQQSAHQARRPKGYRASASVYRP